MNARKAVWFCLGCNRNNTTPHVLGVVVYECIN